VLPVLPGSVDAQVLRWHSKASFDCLLYDWHDCQKIPKSVHTCQCHSKPNLDVFETRYIGLYLCGTTCLTLKCDKISLIGAYCIAQFGKPVRVHLLLAHPDVQVQQNFDKQLLCSIKRNVCTFTYTCRYIYKCACIRISKLMILNQMTVLNLLGLYKGQQPFRVHVYMYFV